MTGTVTIAGIANQFGNSKSAATLTALSFRALADARSAERAPRNLLLACGDSAHAAWFASKYPRPRLTPATAPVRISTGAILGIRSRVDNCDARKAEPFLYTNSP